MSLDPRIEYKTFFNQSTLSFLKEELASKSSEKLDRFMKEFAGKGGLNIPEQSQKAFFCKLVTLIGFSLNSYPETYDRKLVLKVIKVFQESKILSSENGLEEKLEIACADNCSLKVSLDLVSIIHNYLQAETKDKLPYSPKELQNKKTRICRPGTDNKLFSKQTIESAKAYLYQGGFQEQPSISTLIELFELAFYFKNDDAVKVLCESYEKLLNASKEEIDGAIPKFFLDSVDGMGAEFIDSLFKHNPQLFKKEIKASHLPYTASGNYSSWMGWVTLKTVDCLSIRTNEDAVQAGLAFFLPPQLLGIFKKVQYDSKLSVNLEQLKLDFPNAEISAID